MAADRAFGWKDNCNYAYLKERSGTEITDDYMEILHKIDKEKGILGHIFSRAMSHFTNLVNLKRIITLINEIE